MRGTEALFSDFFFPILIVIVEKAVWDETKRMHAEITELKT